MGSLDKRIAELEERFARAARDEEEADPDRAYFEATGEPRPEVFIRYDQAVEGFRAALEAAKAANPGSSRIPETPELVAANDEMLRAREELRAYANSRDREIGSERRDGAP